MLISEKSKVQYVKAYKVATGLQEDKQYDFLIINSLFIMFQLYVDTSLLSVNV